MKLKYICQYCNKELTRKDGLISHENKCIYNPLNKDIKTTCTFCNKKFLKACALAVHQRVCKLNPNRKPLLNNGNPNIRFVKHKAPYGTWKCKWCDKEIIFNIRKELQEHLKEKHPEKCKCWNKGLTKDTNNILKHAGEIISNNYKSGKVIPGFLGKTHSKESKEKMSKAHKKLWKQGDSIFATAREKRKSYPEEYFASIFKEYIRNYHVDRYFLDFAWPDKKIYIEVDGEQHYTESGLNHDKERTKILEKLGWKCISRIRWKNYINLSFEEKEKFINDLLIEINI